MNQKTIDRFRARIDRNGPVPEHCPELGPCHVWQGWLYKNGYGGFGEHQYAHRIAWEIEHGPIPAGMSVLHRCDFRVCCNPDHLFLGSQRDNIRDMYAKNREAHNRGELAGTAKLSNEAAQRIRELYATGNYMQSELGEMFGVNGSSISAIVRGKQYVTAETVLYPMPIRERDARGRWAGIKPAEKLAA